MIMMVLKKSRLFIKKLKLITIFNLFFLPTSILAEGFSGDKYPEINIEKWQCEYCPELLEWDINLGSSFTFLEEKNYHFANYSGLENQSNLNFNGEITMRQEDGTYWQTTFEKLGLTPAQNQSTNFQSSYGQQGNYSVGLEYQQIPIRKYETLATPFINPGAANLQLNNDWILSDNARNFNDQTLFSHFDLGTDWDILGIKLALTENQLFDYHTSYRRLTKQGIRESSSAQMINATYLPFPVDQSSEDFNASITYSDNLWLISLMMQLSRFENNIDSISFEQPFIGLVPGSELTSIASEPDNNAVHLSLNTQYQYASGSFAKIRYSTARLTQDEIFLAYTTNQNLFRPLPTNSLDGKVDTTDLSLQLHHKFNADWRLRLKHRTRDRDNKSPQLLLSPVMFDVYTSSSLMNLPYDFNNQSNDASLEYRFLNNQLLSLGYLFETKTRNFQTIYKTEEEGFKAKCRANLSDELNLMFTAEKFTRDNSTPELIDFLDVTENPLMRRFNIANRNQNKVNFQISYNPFENLAGTFSASFSEQDYKQTEIGLTNNHQNNFNIDVNYLVDDKTNLSVFYQKENIKTDMNGSRYFSNSDWFVADDDNIDSYGMSFSMKELIDERLNLIFDFSRSDADTLITVTKDNTKDSLPMLTSLWSHAELKLEYQHSQKIRLDLSYNYQSFKSADFSIDGVNPGTVTNLITFGTLSHNYNFNYWVLSMNYHF